MRANIVIDDKRMASAIKATGLKIKRAVVKQGLKLIMEALNESILASSEHAR